MPTYRVEIPGRGTYRVESPVELTDQQAYASVMQQLGGAATPEPKKGMGAAFQRGLEGLLSSGQTAVEASMMSPEEAARRGLARGEAMQQKYADQISMDAIKKAYEKDGVMSAAGEVARQIPYAIAEQSPQLAESIAGARIGATAGAPLGPYGALAGGTLGAFLPSYVHQRGAFIERQAAEQQKRGEPLRIDMTKADEAAIKAAGLDVVGTFAGFGSKLVSKATGIPLPAMFGASAAKAEKLANERLLTALGKGSLRFGAVEMPTEIAQTMLERQQAGLPLTSPDAYDEYGRTAYQIGLLSPIGGAGRVMERGGARTEVAQRQVEEQAQQQQVAAEARRAAEAQAREQEEESKRQLEEYKASPEYAEELRAKYDALKAKDAELLAAAQVKADPTDPASVQMKKDAAKALKAFRTSDEYKNTVKEYIAAGRPVAPAQQEEVAPAEPTRGFATEDYTKVKQPGEGVAEPETEAAPPAQNVITLMDELDVTNGNIDELRAQRTKMREEGNTDEYLRLGEELRKMNEARDSLTKQIDEMGGVTTTAEEFEPQRQKELKSLQDKIKRKNKAWNDAETLGDDELADKRAKELKALQQQLADLEAKTEEQRKLLTVKATPKDETVPLFPTDIAQPKSTKVLEAGAGPQRYTETTPELDAYREQLAELRKQDVAAMDRYQRSDYEEQVRDLQDKITDAESRLNLQPRRGTKQQYKKQLPLELEPKPFRSRLSPPWSSAAEREAAKTETPEGESLPLFRDIPQRGGKQVRPADAQAGPFPGVATDTKAIKSKQAEVDAVSAQLEEALAINEERDAKLTERREAATKYLNELRQKYYDIGQRSDMDDDAREAARANIGRRINELERDLPKMTPEAARAGKVDELGRMLNRAYMELDILRSGGTLPAAEAQPQVGKSRGRSYEFGAAPAVEGAQKDLFTNRNLLRVALQNGDNRIADLMERVQKETAARRGEKERKVYDEQAYLRGLETRFNLPGVVVQALRRGSFGYSKQTGEALTSSHGELESALRAISHRYNQIHSTTGTAKTSLTDRMEAAKKKMDELQAKIDSKTLKGQDLTGAKKALKKATTDYNEYKQRIGRLNNEIQALYKGLIKTTGTSQEAREAQRVETIRARKAREGRARLAVPEVSAKDRPAFEKGLAEIEARISEEVSRAESDEEVSNIEARGEDEKQQYYNRFRVEKTLSKEAKQQRKSTTAAKLKADPTRVARELGEATDEYRLEKEAAQPEIDAINAKYNKWNDGAKGRLEKLKATKGDTSEAYKKAEASYVEEGNKRLADRDAKLANVQAQLDEVAQKIGRAQPGFRGELVKATKTRVERAAEAPVAQVQKSKRTKQETRTVRVGEGNFNKRGAPTFATGSEESRARTAARQAGFESREAGVAASERRAGVAEALKRGTASEKNKALQQAFEAARKSKKPPAFRTGVAAGAVVDPTDARARIVEIKSRLPKGVDLTYVPELENISPELDALLREHGWDGKSFKGVVLPDGKIIVVGNTHTDMLDLEATLLHEMIGHYGIDTVIGLDKLTDFARDTNLEKLAKKLGGDELWNEAVAAMNFAVSQKGSPDLAALREIIAHTMEQRVNESFLAKAGRWLKELVGMARSALRSMGFVDATKLSTSDVYYMLKQANDQFNNRKLGPYRNADGVMAFRSPTLPMGIAQSFGVEKKSWKDEFLGNITGLAGRMQYVDKYAALDELQRKGLEKGVISDLEAENAQFFLRFGEQVSEFAVQAMTVGPLQLTYQDTKRGREYYYTTKDGATLSKMADAIAPSKIGNDVEKEAILTALIAGERAKAVGWEKLNVSDPDAARAEYQKVADLLNANPKDKAMFENAMNIYREYNAGQLDFLVQTGTMTKEKAAELKSVPYIPYYRVNKNNGDVDLYVDKETILNIGNVKSEPELEPLVGDNKRIQPIYTSAVQNTFLLTRMALRNKMINENVLLLDKLGVVSKMGTGAGPANPSTIRYKFKGKDMFAVIDQDVYGVPAEFIVKGMEGVKTTMPAIIQAMGVPADILRKFITRSPAYAIKQAVRDPLAAWFSTGMDGVPILNSFTELGKSLAGRNDAQAKLMRAGAISSNVFTGDKRDLEMALRDVSEGKQGLAWLMSKADALAMQGDAATRAVIYRDSINKGMSEMQALLRTLESMNFRRRGLSPSVYAMSTVIPFLNAQIQGLDVVYRTFKNRMPFAKQLDLRNKLIQRATLFTSMSLAYAMYMQDDDDYKRAKPEERYNNWFVRLPFFDEPVKIPIPFEFGFLFKAVPEAIINTAMGDEKAKRSVMGLAEIGKTFNPFGIPAAVKPGIELYLGRSFLSGNDIESKRELDTMMEAYRARPTTSEAAKALGPATSMVGLSPIELDYLARGYTGPLGMFIIQMTNPFFRMFTGDRPGEMPSTPLSKTAMVGTLFQSTEPRAVLDEAYDRMLEIQQAAGTYKQMLAEGRRDEAKEFFNQYSNRIALVSMSGAAQQKLGEIASMRRMIASSPKLSQERKDELLERIDNYREKYAQMFISAADRTKPLSSRP